MRPFIVDAAHNVTELSLSDAADGRRIAASVRACDGMTTEEIEALGHGGVIRALLASANAMDEVIASKRKERVK